MTVDLLFQTHGLSLRTPGELENVTLYSVNENNEIIRLRSGVRCKEVKPGPVNHWVFGRSTDILYTGSPPEPPAETTD